MVCIMQGLASSEWTHYVHRHVPRCKDTYSSYIEYLPLPHVVTVLESQGRQ